MNPKDLDLLVKELSKKQSEELESNQLLDLIREIYHLRDHLELAKNQMAICAEVLENSYKTGEPPYKSEVERVKRISVKLKNALSIQGTL